MARLNSLGNTYHGFQKIQLIYSRFTDYYKMSRYVVLIASTFSLLGHCTLIMFRSEYGILLGKIFIGFGMSCDGSILGQVGRKEWGHSDDLTVEVPRTTDLPYTGIFGKEIWCICILLCFSSTRFDIFSCNQLVARCL